MSHDALSREKINQYQLQRLRETIRLAACYSPYYRKSLRGFAETDIACLKDLRRLPYTTSADIRLYGRQFLCVSQREISRVVTLESSGTTGRAKSLFFTDADQELTIDFFRCGMSTMVGAGDRVLIFLPGERPGSIGDLLATALQRLGAMPIRHGFVSDISDTLTVLGQAEADALVGVPSQVLALTRWADRYGKARRLKSVLLSTDYVPRAIAREVERVWRCDVFTHYGMTEMGFGGGTECRFHNGLHLYEADFYFEIADPLTGAIVSEGEQGEVVVTTLTRRGMPLIRYRTGDISRFVPGKCSCGAILRRLDCVTRRDSAVTLGGGRQITTADLDEKLFAVNEIIDFMATVDSTDHAAELGIRAWSIGRQEDNTRYKIYEALDSIAAIRLARQRGQLMVKVMTEECRGTLPTSGTKRRFAVGMAYSSAVSENASQRT